MKIKGLAALALLCVGVSACSSSVARPDVVTALADTHQKLAVVDVTCTARPDVKMDPAALDRIKGGLLTELEHAKPASLMAKANPDNRPVTLKLTFTAYDEGSAVARLMLIGMGQIHIDADIAILDASGNTIGVYKVAKQFAIGGLVGGTTRIEDVEKGFENSVVELVRDPSQTSAASSREKKKDIRPL
jgi:hypothetical protein